MDMCLFWKRLSNRFQLYLSSHVLAKRNPANDVPRWRSPNHFCRVDKRAQVFFPNPPPNGLCSCRPWGSRGSPDGPLH